MYVGPDAVCLYMHNVYLFICCDQLASLMHPLYVESHDKVACEDIENTLTSCMQVFDAAHSMPPNAIYTSYIVCTLSTQTLNPVALCITMLIRSPLQD